MGRSLAAGIRAANATLFVKGDLDEVATFFTKDYVAHVTGQEMRLGHAGVRRVLRLYSQAFTDIRVDVEILVHGKDRVAWQRTLHGIHTGPFRGFPGTGRAIVWRDMVVSRFRGGLIAEDWLVTDLAERLLRTRKT